MEFRFTNEVPLSQIDEVIEHSLGPRLWIPNADYPDQYEWAEKAAKELRQGIKRNMVALHKNEVVGSIIYQRDKTDPKILEIKRVTVRPDLKGRFIASFLLRNTEIEGSIEFNTSIIQLDAKARNQPLKAFFLKHHYRIATQADLYGLGAGEDIVFQKSVPILIDHQSS